MGATQTDVLPRPSQDKIDKNGRWGIQRVDGWAVAVDFCILKISVDMIQPPRIVTQSSNVILPKCDFGKKHFEFVVIKILAN